MKDNIDVTMRCGARCTKIGIQMSNRQPSSVRRGVTLRSAAVALCGNSQRSGHQSLDVRRLVALDERRRFDEDLRWSHQCVHLGLVLVVVVGNLELDRLLVRFCLSFFNDLVFTVPGLLPAWNM